ncbi:MAG TPA: secretin N-terminal domain-containing protein [Pirellulales bacterium]|nr:secretin N-terminal domain-containing protein [Pirellulales bacterium]
MRYRVLSVLALCAATLLAASDDARGQFRGGRRRGGGGDPYGRDMQAPPAVETKKSEEEKKDEKADEKKDDEKKPEEKKDEGPPPIQRPLEPDRPPDPSELTAKPDKDGKISFSFNGQPWPAVLEWLADISDMSLEWDEAPAGYVNLTTHGFYSVDEVRDMLNSYLLNKGFTVLRNGEVLIVMNLKKLDYSLVPRVRPDDLDQRGTYELVRTFFDLDWLVAEAAAEEIKPLLSPFGKVTPLKATNRLDAIDTAGNLRRIRELLSEEQSSNGQQRLVREFKLRFTRAAEVLDTLNTLLGIETKQAAAPVDPRQLMQAMMMAQQGGGQAMPQLGKKENTVFLAVNARENSILANAPPDKIGVIEQAIEAVDVPQGRGKGLLADAQRVKVYRLSGLQPETMVKVLKELGSLDPTTKLEVDVKKNALIVYAPLADHLLITDLVERLDGASRRFEVIQLRTLSAEYVAGSILTLMNGPEKQNESGRSRYPYYFFDSGSQQQQDSTDKFWVEADVERNRLLLRANDVELTEVRALLVKLGEIPADERYGTETRVVPVAPNEETLEALKQIQSELENPLLIDINPSALQSRRRSKNAEEEEPASGRRRAATQEPMSAPGMGPGTGRGSGERPQRRERGNRSTQQTRPASRFRLAQDRVSVESEEEDAGVGQDEGAGADEGVRGPEGAPASGVREDEGDAAAPADAEKGEAPDADAEKTASEPGEAAMEEDTGDEAGSEQKPVAPATEEPPSKKGTLPHDDELPAEPSELPRRAHAPIRIKLSPQGLVISSSDPEALDRLEERLNNIMPPKTNHEFFTLKHTYAKDMVLLLKDIFKAEMGKDSNSRTEVFDMFWNGYRGGSSGQQTRNTLSRRRPLSFVADPVTNTVLVQGADASQLAEIEDLIERYDRAEPPNSESVRRTMRVPLRYAKAKEVAEVIKDVYRDLLSPNDKALLANQPPQQPGRERGGGGDNFYSAMFSYLTDDPTKSEIVPRFKGMLSVGIDERANGVVISAPQIILTEVLKLVGDLDRDARPSRSVVRVLKVRNPGTAAQVRQAVAANKVQTAPAATTPAPGTTDSSSPSGQGRAGRFSGTGAPAASR